MNMFLLCSVQVSATSMIHLLQPNAPFMHNCQLNFKNSTVCLRNFRILATVLSISIDPPYYYFVYYTIIIIVFLILRHNVNLCAYCRCTEAMSKHRKWCRNMTQVQWIIQFFLIIQVLCLFIFNFFIKSLRVHSTFYMFESHHWWCAL